jgi:multiple RNA-binding domain-containing protein 1
MESLTIFSFEIRHQVTSDKIQKLFSQKGEVTDVQMKTDKKGNFRGFAFVGFRSETAAEEAQQFFDNNYVDTSKIRVELCIKREKVDAEDSAVSATEAGRDSRPATNVKDEFSEMMGSSEFQEFIKVQRNLGKRKHIWDDDVMMDEIMAEYKKQKTEEPAKEAKDAKKVKADPSAAKKVKADPSAANKGKKKEEKEDKEDKEDKTNDENEQKKKKEKKKKNLANHKFTIRIKNVPKKHKNKTSIRKFFEPIPLSNIRIPEIAHVAYVSFETETAMKQALIKHKSFLGANQVLLHPVVTKDESSGVQMEYNQHKNRIEKSVPVENIEQTGRLFVRNLNYNVTQTELEEVFNKYGPTTEVTLPVDTQTEKVKGFAFVTYMFPEHAMKAFSELDRSTFQGRLLHVIPAEVKRGDSYNEMPKDGSSFKKQKASEIKEGATRSHNWNALFLRADAVAELTSAKLNITKTQMLMDDANQKDSLAARMALAETQLVQETKVFLEQNGVHLKSFDEYQVPRSRTIMLIKNLAANTDLSELTTFIEKFGKIKRILLPPTGVTALVEMNTEAVALQAFKKLAYSTYKRSPLYLEWAPMNVFKPDLTAEQMKQDDESKQDENSNQHESSEVPKKNEEQEDRQPETNTVLYVKNLNPKTKESDMLKHFSQAGKVFKVTIAEKKSPDGVISSMGYGFVQYYMEYSAKKALKKLELSKLDDYALSLKLSANPFT